jgi:hypothetical protein
VLAAPKVSKRPSKIVSRERSAGPNCQTRPIPPASISPIHDSTFVCYIFEKKNKPMFCFLEKPQPRVKLDYPKGSFDVCFSR